MISIAKKNAISVSAKLSRCTVYQLTVPVTGSPS